MRIYVNGCSFACGDELDQPDVECWPAVLARQLDAELVNDSTLGGSNARTVYRTIKHLPLDFDLYVIAWTSDTKFTFYKSDDGTEVNFSPQLKHMRLGQEVFYKIWGRTLYQVWYNRTYGFKLWLQQIIQLQTLLEKNNKRYLMINTTDNGLVKWSAPWTTPQNQFIDAIKKFINFDMMNDEQIFAEYEEIQYYLGQINTSTFYGWGEFTMHSLRDQFATGPRGHLLTAGHQHVADLIYKHITTMERQPYETIQ
jgi:hypothetical protein